MDRGKIVAIITGAISLFLAIVYLILVQILDSRTEMVPAPISQAPTVVSWSTSNVFVKDDRGTERRGEGEKILLFVSQSSEQKFIWELA